MFSVRWVFAVMKNDIDTVTTETEGTRGIASERAVRRRSVTGRGDTERKKKGDTSPHGGIVWSFTLYRLHPCCICLFVSVACECYC